LTTIGEIGMMKKVRLSRRRGGDMPYAGRKKPDAITLGVFVPCDPRIDEESRLRAFNIGQMTAGLLARRLRLPDGSAPNVYFCSHLVDSEKTADSMARELKEAGAAGLFIVPDTWFFPGKTALALTAHFAPSTPIACVGGNNAPKPGVVGIDALVGAYAQTGRLCPMVVGNMPETGINPEFDKKTQAEIVDLAYAMLAKAALQGKRFLAVDTDSMQMETALNHVHAARRFFGLESTRESMKIFADMLRKKGGYDRGELEALRDWVVNVKFKGRVFTNGDEIKKSGRGLLTGARVKAPALAVADRAKLDEGLALYLIVRNYMREVNAIGGGWTNQLAWGSDRRGLPLATADIAESLFNSTEDHAGKKPVVPFATENDIQGLLTMIAYCYLSGGNPTLFMDFRKVYEPWEIEANARTLGISLEKLRNEPWMLRGFIDGNNSGSASLDYGDKWFLFKAVEYYFPGLGFSVSYLSPKGISGMAGRIAYSDLGGMFTMVQDEAQSVELPAKIAEKVCHASDYTWPHTFLTFDHVPASLAKTGMPANHFHMVTGLPRRRWQHFSDYTLILNYRWENAPEYTEGLDRPLPMLFRTNGGETAAKMMLAGRR
jgi:L-fucose isomerase